MAIYGHRDGIFHVKKLEVGNSGVFLTGGSASGFAGGGTTAGQFEVKFDGVSTTYYIPVYEEAA